MRSLRASITTQSIVLLIVYLCGLAGVYATFTFLLVRRESAAAVQRLEQTGRLVGAEIDAYVASGRQRLETVAALPGLVYGLQSLRDASRGAPIPPWTTLHYLFFGSSVFTGGVLLADDDGLVLWGEPPGQPWVGSRLAGELPRSEAAAVSPVRGPGRLLDRPHVVVAVPIANPEGGVAGTLAGIIDLGAPEFTQILAALPATGDRFVRVVDQHGRVLASTDGAPPRADHAGTIAADVVTAVSGLGHAPWWVVAGERRAALRAELWPLQRALIGLGAVVVALAAAIGWPFVRGFVRGVRTLTAHAEVMAGGDLSRPVVVPDRRDELALLAGTFERMRQQLARSRGALERRLRERDELIRLKEEFLANVSHELRTPLNVIIGYSDLLGDDEPSAERRNVLGRLRLQAEHLFQLVQDLMTLSGLNTGKLELNVQALDPTELRTRLSPLVEHLGAGKPIAFRWEIDPALPPIETDPLRLEQALANLVTNAFKFTTRGEIVVRLRRAADAAAVLCEVVDTGIGIAADDLAHIFDEFRQVDGSMRRHHGGMGLGLALVRRLADLLGGAITVTSRVGVGSTFTLTLPLRLSSAPAADVAGLEPPAPASATV